VHLGPVLRPLDDDEDLLAEMLCWRGKRDWGCSQSELAIDIQFETRRETMNESQLLGRITVNPAIFGGKPIIRGRRLAVEHVLAMLAAGDSPETILTGYPWLEREDVQACLVYARRMVGHERIEPLTIAEAAP
jgi:uncharacterized protein (DUF433 family)